MSTVRLGSGHVRLAQLCFCGPHDSVQDFLRVGAAVIRHVCASLESGSAGNRKGLVEPFERTTAMLLEEDWGLDSWKVLGGMSHASRCNVSEAYALSTCAAGDDENVQLPICKRCGGK